MNEPNKLNMELIARSIKGKCAYFDNYDKLTSLEPIQKYQGLESITFSSNSQKKIPDLTPLTELPRLRSLSFFNKSVPENIQVISGCSSLSKLILNSKGIKDFSFIKDMKTQLEHLEIHCSNITDISPIKEQKNLKTLVLRSHQDRSSLLDVKCISGFGKLVTLDISGSLIADLLFLNAPLLKELKVDNCPNLKSFKGLERSVGLEVLYANFTAAESLEPLASLKKLKGIYLRKTKIQSLKGIENCVKLDRLYTEKSNLKSIEHISGLANLKLLWIFDTKINDLSPISNLRELTELNLAGCRKIESFAVLSNLDNLKELDLFQTSFSDPSLLEQLPNLKKVRLAETPAEENREQLKAVLEKLSGRMSVSFSKSRRW